MCSRGLCCIEKNVCCSVLWYCGAVQYCSIVVLWSGAIWRYCGTMVRCGIAVLGYCGIVVRYCRASLCDGQGTVVLWCGIAVLNVALWCGIAEQVCVMDKVWTRCVLCFMVLCRSAILGYCGAVQYCGIVVWYYRAGLCDGQGMDRRQTRRAQTVTAARWTGPVILLKAQTIFCSNYLLQ